MKTSEPLQELTYSCLEWMKANDIHVKTVAEAIDDIKKNPEGTLATAIEKGIQRDIMILFLYRHARK